MSIFIKYTAIEEKHLNNYMYTDLFPQLQNSSDKSLIENDMTHT